MQVGEELQSVMAICGWEERGVDLWVGCESRRCPPFWGTKVAYVFGWVLLWLAYLFA